MKTFATSVIIPVYNAAKFLRAAVLSCVNLQSVQEVILVEDHSPGNDWQVCMQLEKEFEKVVVFRTAKNSGASVARNLGVCQAKAPYLSFLDADDEYLPNRFAKAEELFYADSSMDACFGAVTCFFENNRVKDQFVDKGFELVTHLKNFLPHMNALEALLGFQNNVSGHIHLNALTIKKESFPSKGFNSKLRLHQDTELIYRAAFNKKWVSIGADPVAKRRVHEENRITSEANGVNSNLKLYTELLCTPDASAYSHKIRHFFMVRWIRNFKKCSKMKLKLVSLFLVVMKNSEFLMNRYFLSNLLLR